MAGSGAGAWARLRLVQGNSAMLNWELAGSRDETRLTVGSHANCQWVIDDPSVEPFHLVLHWDGTSLFAAQAQESSPVRLDGQRVGSELVRVSGRARLEFGRCAIVAETSVGHARQSQSPPPRDVPPPSNEASSVSSLPPKGSEGSSGLRLGRTLMGVAPTPAELRPEASQSSAPPPASASDSVRPFKQTVVGMGVVSKSGSPGPSGEREQTGSHRVDEGSERPSGAGERPRGATLYGLGDVVRNHIVDRVSPDRLRRSSIPPASPSEEPSAGRTTDPGFADPDELPRETQLGFDEPLPASAASSTRRAIDAPAGSASDSRPRRRSEPPPHAEEPQLALAHESWDEPEAEEPFASLRADASASRRQAAFRAPPAEAYREPSLPGEGKLQAVLLNIAIGAAAMAALIGFGYVLITL